MLRAHKRHNQYEELGSGLCRSNRRNVYHIYALFQSVRAHGARLRRARRTVSAVAFCVSYVGKKECVENAAFRLTSPGLGKEVGASLGILSAFYEGLFLAPNVTASALKGAIFAANVYEKLGFSVIPDSTQERYDIIQAVNFGTPEALIAFCEGIQAASPVDSHVRPEPWDMPGYDAKVIMAAGAFVSGSSIELSADGPLKEPYAAYFQGGITWQHAKFGIMRSVQSLVDKGLVLSEL